MCGWKKKSLLRKSINCFQWFSLGGVIMDYFLICSFQIFHKGHVFLS